MSEVCSRCEQPCVPELLLRNTEGEDEPLCKNCTDKFFEEDTDYP